jgi:hypothetical protein
MFLILLSSGKAGAALDEWAIGAKAGTLGLGGDLTTDILPGLNLRGGVQWLSLNLDAEFEDIDYSVDVDFLNPLLLLDWYPFGGSFRLSGGVLFNQSDVNLRATPSAPVQIGGTTYTPAEVGTLRGQSDFNPIAPYVGIGWGNVVGRSKRLGLAMDLGVAFIGSPGVNLSANGLLASDPTFQAHLAQEEEDIEDDLSDFKFYPVLSLTLYYCF